MAERVRAGADGYFTRRERLAGEGVPELFLPRHRQGTRDTAVLLLHSLTATPAETDYLAEALHAAGFGVFQCLAAGHGRDVARLIHTDRAAWIARAEADFAAAAERYARVGVIAYSTHGLLALRLAATRPVAFCAVVAPSLQIRSRLAPLAGLLSLVHPGKRTRVLPGLEGWYLPRMPFAAVWQTVRLGKETRACLPRITAPFLAVHSQNDRIIDPASTDIAWREVGSLDRACLLLGRDLHLPVVPGGERAALVRDVLVRFAARVTGGEPGGRAWRAARAPAGR